MYGRVVVQGPGPGPRYGHVMALVGQRYLMAIGGNDGESLERFSLSILLIELKEQYLVAQIAIEIEENGNWYLLSRETAFG